MLLPAGAGVPLTNVTHIPAPYMFPELDTLNYIETLLTDDHSACGQASCCCAGNRVQADGGINVFDVEWLKGSVLSVISMIF